MQKRGWASIWVLLGAVGGCAEGPYVYRPAQATTTMSGLPASSQPIPRDKPSGDIVVATSGVTEIKGDSPTRAIFVRVVVSNRTDDAAWDVDTRKQTALIAGQPTTAAYVNAYEGYEGTTSVVRVRRGQSRTMDFYFPLPASIQADDDLPPLELSWNVQAGRQVVADRTPFNRVAVEPVYASGSPYSYGYPSYGYPGPYGWYDPFWPPVHIGIGVGYGHFYGHPRGYYRGGGPVYHRGRVR